MSRRRRGPVRAGLACAAIALSAACGEAFEVGAGGPAPTSSTGGTTHAGGAGGTTHAGGAGGVTHAGGAGGITHAGGGGGSPSDAGAPDADTDPCAGVTGGAVFGDHCYVDVTTSTATFAEARTACQALGSLLGLHGDVPVLGSAMEDAFVFSTFVEATKTTYDAWIGLVCDAAAHPNVDDCFCLNGCVDPGEQAKLASWTWVGGEPSAYRRWSVVGPNGDGRCAAMRAADAADAAVADWTWGDRDCATNVMVGRQYRTICELE